MSVDECDALLKKHDAFERLIASQEEKVSKFYRVGVTLCLMKLVIGVKHSGFVFAGSADSPLKIVVL